MRMTLDMQALPAVSKSLKLYHRMSQTYNKAVAKTALIPSLCLKPICSFQTQMMGSNSSTRSEVAFITLVIMLTASMLTHFPGNSGFQNLALGVQTNIATKVIAV